MERKERIIQELLGSLQDLDILLNNPNAISKPDVIRNLEKFSSRLVAMNDEGQRLDESSSRVVPVDVFQALDAGADISLESFERKLVQAALDKGDRVKAKAKYLQDIEKQLTQGTKEGK